MKKTTLLKPTNLVIGAFTLLISSNLLAAEHEIKMLNNGADGSMVFEPGYLKVDPGDTVKFIAVDQGHNTVSFFVPEGAEAWKGAISEEISVTLNTKGLYLYKCDPHSVLAMAGVIQVGAASNLDMAKEAEQAFSSQIAINKGRMGKYLAQVQ